MVASVVGWFCIMKLGGSKTENLSKTKKSIHRMITLAIAVTATYELFYNFVVWNALSGIFRIDGVLSLQQKCSFLPPL